MNKKESMQYPEKKTLLKQQSHMQEERKAISPRKKAQCTVLHQFPPPSQPKGKNGDMRKKVPHSKKQQERAKLN